MAGCDDNKPNDMRLDKLLARSGVASRRSSAEIISDGRVVVDGRTIRKPGCRVDPSSCILVDCEPIAGLSQRQDVYIKLHKPPGFITTTDDPEGRKTVMHLVSDIPQRIYPVGRLDRDSSGLLLMTNDGSWAQKIIHPRYQVSKVYLVWVNGSPDHGILQDLRCGVSLADGEAGFNEVDLLHRGSDVSHLRVSLQEGRYREIRRLLATVGHPVVRLQRVQIGSVGLEDLSPGEWRHLNGEEVNSFSKVGV